MLLLDFYVPHGHCYLWQTDLVSLHIISDTLIAIAYYSIPLLLIYFIRQRKDTPFKGVLLLFITFILACGTTHLMAVWTIWHPDYWLSGLIKAFTALVSCYTAIVLIKLIPQALALPSQAELEQEIRNKEEAEVKLKESQYFIQQITDTTPTILYIYDLEEKRNIYSNRAIGDILGYSSQTIKDMGAELLIKVVHPDDLPKMGQHHQNLTNAKKNDTLEIEHRAIHSSGEWRWLYSRDTAFAFNSDGKVKQILGSCIDITERKQAEIKLKAYREHLEELVSTRTTELQGEIIERRQAEENLRQSNRELARSNEELEQFAYIASHDLQEPLRAVTSYAQLLEKRYVDQLDEKAQKYIINIVDGGTRMQQLINDLLNYSRVGTKGAEFQPVATEKIVKRVLANLKIAIVKSKAKITYDPLPTITGDQSQLIQLFQNLISNAIKFHGDAPPQIHIWATKESQAWHFCIRDRGIGIEAEYADRIFVIFQRLHSRSKYPGTGIGLAICKKIVERHKGKIWLDSKLGEGSTFYFSFPFLKQDM